MKTPIQIQEKISAYRRQIFEVNLDLTETLTENEAAYDAELAFAAIHLLEWVLD